MEDSSKKSNNEDCNENQSTPNNNVCSYQLNQYEYCYFNCCIKLEIMMGIIGIFDAILYTTLSCICSYVLLMFESRGKYDTTTNSWWTNFRITNGDGIYVLFASYVISSVSGWIICLRFMKMTRSPILWWLMCNVYSTCLQILAMIFFPFNVNLLNVIPIIIRLFEYWIVLSWDRFLLARGMNKWMLKRTPTYLSHANRGPMCI